MQGLMRSFIRNVMPDVLASIVVFLVALPLCMGIAIASGLPAEYGLLTGIIGGLVVGFLQGSPLQVSGPAAGLAIIVWDLVQKHGHAKLAVVVMIGGAIQLAAGLLRGGRWFRAVPPSVVHGMLAGIGVLIFSSQFHVMVDDKPQGSGLDNLIAIPLAVWKAIAPDGNAPHGYAALVGILTVAAMLTWSRFAPGRLRPLPGALVGVAVATLVASVLDLPIKRVAVPDSLWATVMLPTAEAARGLLDPALWAAGLMLAVIASAETLLSAAAIDRMHNGPRTQHDRELAAQGIGNLLCGAVGGLPMTGVIVRSSANVQAGATSRRSTILHGAWMLILVSSLPMVLRWIPVASLAAVLVVTGYKLLNLAELRQLRRFGRGEVATYLITLVGIVSLDLLKGVLLGLALAIGRLLWRLSHLDIELQDNPAAQRATLTLRGSASFLRIANIAEALDRVPAGRALHIRVEELDSLDHATLELLTSWTKQHRARGAEVVIDGDVLTERLRAGRHGASPIPSASGGQPEPV